MLLHSTHQYAELHLFFLQVTPNLFVPGYIGHNFLQII